MPATSPAPWCPPPASFLLGQDEVQIWRTVLTGSEASIHALGGILSADERERAGRFRFTEHAARFVIARGVLRILLGRYLDVAPTAVRFCCNPFGKPALAQDSGADALYFNVSHADSVALYAVARRRRVGIDLERIRLDMEIEPIAERFFAPGETRVLRALPAHQQHGAFFRCWTRKEAYIKARGEGLSLPLDSFEVSVAPGEPAALLRTGTDPRDVARWSLQDVPLDPGYIGALAVEGHDYRPTYWEWPES